MWQKNDSYLTVCKSCVQQYFKDYTEDLGSKIKALYRLCLHFDFYYSEEIVDIVKTGEANTWIPQYIKLCNLKRHKGKTFDTYLNELEKKRNPEDELESDEDLLLQNTVTMLEQGEPQNEEDALEKRKQFVAEMSEKFGLGYSPEEYVTYNERYNNLRQQFGLDSDDENDYVVDTAIKNLVSILIMKDRAIVAGDTDQATKLMEKYQKMINGKEIASYLKNKKIGLGAEDSLGKFIKMVEQYTPCEIYTDKKIYDNPSRYKNMLKYLKRFFGRSAHNFFTGNNIRDHEHDIGVDVT